MYLLTLVIAALSGAIAYLAYEPHGLWWCGLLGMALWWGTFLPWRKERAHGLPGFRRGALLGIAHTAMCYLALLPWVGEYVGAWPFLALAGVLAGLWGTASGVLFSLATRASPAWGAVTVPTIWVTVEFCFSRWPFGGFPWIRTAWGQVDGPLAPLARWGGPALISWATVALGCALTTVAWATWLRCSGSVLRRRVGSCQRRQFKKNSNNTALWVSGLMVLFVVAAAITAGNELTSASTKEDGSTRVAAVQGNVPRMGLDFTSQRFAVLRNHVRETEKLAPGSVDIVIWPENSADVSPFANSEAADLVREAAETVDAPVLVGTVSRVNGESRNTMVVVEADGQVGDRHDKRFLQPFGETMPFRDLLRHITDLVDQAGDFRPGTDYGVVSMNNVRVGVATCYEVAFDDAYRDAVTHGAQILATPTNNATFGFTDMTYQQLAMSRLRAIETDRAVVVSATSGVSALIGPDGMVRNETDIFEAVTLVDDLPLKNSQTFAVRWGFWVELALVIMGAVSSILAGVRLIVQRRRSRARTAQESQPTLTGPKSGS